jgi:hypothetical protein
MTEAQLRYEEYLASPHWQRTRAKILTRANNHCEWCGRFCGENPHGSMAPCSDPSCEYCATYYFAEIRVRNDVEEQHLEVHHKTYERRGRELPCDLVAICWSCHESASDSDCGLYT